MEIGTAKVTPADRVRVPHHGLDLVDPDDPFSVSDYVAHVETVLTDLAERGHAALLVGGTGLYTRAIATGMALDALPYDAEVHARIDADLLRDGLESLAARLRSAAPRLAAATDLQNPRRVVRALEIAILAGDIERPAPRGYDGPVLQIGLNVDPVRLRRRIVERAAGQFRDGLVDETAALLARFDGTQPAFSGIGYREAGEVLAGRATVAEALAATTSRTIAYARRQRTWFRAEPGLIWVEADNEAGRDAIGAVLPLVEAFLSVAMTTATDAAAAAADTAQQSRGVDEEP